MIVRTLPLLLLAFTLSLGGFAARPGEIKMHTQKIGDAVHWMPKTIEVTQGETVTFLVTHDLEGGFDFHGFFIPALKIARQVNRHKPEKLRQPFPPI